VKIRIYELELKSEPCPLIDSYLILNLLLRMVLIVESVEVQIKLSVENSDNLPYFNRILWTRDSNRFEKQQRHYFTFDFLSSKLVVTL
jgi:hypothetical protein